VKRILLAILLVLLVPTIVFAVHANDDAVTQSIRCYGNGETCKFVFSWTGDSTDGVVDAATMDDQYYQDLKGYYIDVIVTDPGVGPPTDNYDITLTDDTGLDVTGGVLANRHTTTTQRVLPLVDGTRYGSVPFSSALILTITNQNVNSAKGTVSIFMSKCPRYYW
jgi:hypothetical protein